jgi:hypothetical protein
MRAAGGGQPCDDTRVTRVLRRTAFALAAAAMAVSAGTASQLTVTIPEFWSEELLHDYELPLATPESTPKHVSRDYYYALPERVLYKSYPIYHPSREPAGYSGRLGAGRSVASEHNRRPNPSTTDAGRTVWVKFFDVRTHPARHMISKTGRNESECGTEEASANETSDGLWCSSEAGAAKENRGSETEVGHGARE